MTALATVASILALSGPAPVTLTVRYFDGTEPDHVSHLRCRGDRARADGCAIGDWQHTVPLLPRMRAGRAP